MEGKINKLHRVEKSKESFCPAVGQLRLNKNKSFAFVSSNVLEPTGTVMISVCFEPTIAYKYKLPQKAR